MVELGIKLLIADETYEEKEEVFNFDNREEWDEAWDFMYKECDQGFIRDFESDYFQELTASEVTELNDIMETYMLMDELMESDRTLIRGIYDSGEWSSSLNDLIKLIKNVRLQNV